MLSRGSGYKKKQNIREKYVEITTHIIYTPESMHHTCSKFSVILRIFVLQKKKKNAGKILQIMKVELKNEDTCIAI